MTPVEASMAAPPSLVTAAIDAIDARNGDDPNVVVVDGVARPKEVVHAERMTVWLGRLDDDPAPEQILAARAHHLRRWELPRTSYPEGRAGYLRWRAEAKRRHSREVTEILDGLGFDADVIERVGAIIRKEGLGSDPQVQTHEDALCLTFLESQLDDFSATLGDAKVVEVLARTLPKMSDRAKGLAATVPLSDHGRTLLTDALRVAS
jgi:hypothetical protein